MTLDDAIERELYRTEANKEMADSFHTDENIYSKEEEAYRNREDYHSQIADWLKELKAYRSLRFSIGEILVDESKWHISSEKAIEKIRNKMVDFDSEQRR